MAIVGFGLHLTARCDVLNQNMLFSLGLQKLKVSMRVWDSKITCWMMHTSLLDVMVTGLCMCVFMCDYSNYQQ